MELLLQSERVDPVTFKYPQGFSPGVHLGYNVVLD